MSWTKVQRLAALEMVEEIIIKCREQSDSHELIDFEDPHTLAQIGMASELSGLFTQSVNEYTPDQVIKKLFEVGSVQAEYSDALAEGRILDQGKFDEQVRVIADNDEKIAEFIKKHIFFCVHGNLQ